MDTKNKSPAAYIFFILFITLVISATYLYWESSRSDKKVVRGYLDVIFRISTVVSILVAIYMVQFSYEQRNQTQKQQIDAMLQEGVVEIQKLFMEPSWYDQLALLYAQMNQLPYDKSDNPPLQQVEVIVGNIIFRKIEAVIDSLGGKSPDPQMYAPWLHMWRQWFRSDRLRAVWWKSCDQFSLGMQGFIHSIIGL